MDTIANEPLEHQDQDVQHNVEPTVPPDSLPTLNSSGALSPTTTQVHPQNALLEILNQHSKLLGYSASELQMIVRDMGAAKPVTTVADPTPQLADILNSSVVPALERFAEESSRSELALKTGSEIAALTKRISALNDEESRMDVRATTSTLLDEKLDVSKKLVEQTEARCDALDQAHSSISSLTKQIPSLKTEALSSLVSLASSLAQQEQTLSTTHSHIVATRKETDDWLKQNQLEINALEERLRILKQERTRRIADHSATNLAAKQTTMEDALAMNKLAQMAVTAEQSLVSTTMNKVQQDSNSLSSTLSSSKTSADNQLISHLQSLATTLALWINKREGKVALLTKLVKNAEEAEGEGFGVTLDVAKTRKEIEDLQKLLEEHKAMYSTVESRLRGLGATRTNPDDNESVSSSQSEPEFRDNEPKDFSQFHQQFPSVQQQMQPQSQQTQSSQSTYQQSQFLSTAPLSQVPTQPSPLTQQGSSLSSSYSGLQNYPAPTSGTSLSSIQPSYLSSTSQNQQPFGTNPAQPPYLPSFPSSTLPQQPISYPSPSAQNSYSSSQNTGFSVPPLSSSSSQPYSSSSPQPYSSSSTQPYSSSSPQPYSSSSQQYPSSTSFTYPPPSNQYSNSGQQSYPTASSQQPFSSSSFSYPNYPTQSSAPSQPQQFSSIGGFKSGSDDDPSFRSSVTKGSNQTNTSSSPKLDNVAAKLVELGVEIEEARKASAKATELNLPLKEAVDMFLSGTLFTAKPAAGRSTVKPPTPAPVLNEEVQKKLLDLGFDKDTARKGAITAHEQNLSVSDAVDLVLTGKLDSSTSTSTSTTPASSVPSSSPYSSLSTPTRTNPTPTPAPSSARSVPVQTPPPSSVSTAFGSFLELQEKSLLKKTWKPLYFALEGPNIVYGNPKSQSVSKHQSLKPSDLSEVGRISLEKNWSVFEKEGGDGPVFEIHNPRASNNYLLKAETNDLKNEWIQRVKQRIRDIEEGRVTSQTESEKRSGEGMKKKDIIDALMSMGFPAAVSEQASVDAHDVNEALERAMALNFVDKPAQPQRKPQVTPSTSAAYLSKASAPSAPSPATSPAPSPASSQNRGMAKCGSCGSGFSYPMGATRVQCHSCGVVNNLPAPQQQAKSQSAIQLQCGHCKARAEISLGQDSFVCRECNVVNHVKLS